MPADIHTPGHDVPKRLFQHSSAVFGLEVVELSSIQARSNKHSSPSDLPHRLDFHLLLLIEQGVGHHLVDFEHIPFEPGSAFFLNAGQIQAFDFSSTLAGKAIVYTPQFIETLQSKMSIPLSLGLSLPNGAVPHLLLGGELKQRTQRLIEELAIEMHAEVPSLAIVSSLFSALMMMLSRERTAHTVAEKSSSLVDTQKFMAFQALIERYGYTCRDASFYADKLGVSYKTLNVLCKKVGGDTAKQHIDHYVILEAKRRLLIDLCDIATIADNLGFKETTNFTKFFKRYTSQTPNQFRQQVRH